MIQSQTKNIIPINKILETKQNEVYETLNTNLVDKTNNNNLKRDKMKDGIYICNQIRSKY